MNLPHLSKRESRILSFTGLTVILALSYNFLFEPLIKKWKDLNSAIISKQIKLEKSHRIIEEKPIILKSYNSYYPFLKTKGNNEEEMRLFLGQIEELSKKNNVSIKEIKPGRIEDKKLYKEFSCNIEIEAEISDISKFLYELTKPPYLLKTKRFELRAKGGKDSFLKGSLLITKLTLI